MLLLDRLNADEEVSKRSIARLIGEEAMARFELEWRSELHSRGHKPLPLVKYAALLRKANIQYAKAQTASSRGRKTQKLMFDRAELLFEAALENLHDVVYADPNLRLWLDRDPEVGFKYGTGTITLDPEGMPRPTWQVPGLAKKLGLTQLTKRELKIAALEQALEKLNYKEEHEVCFSTHCSSKRIRNMDFSSFRF